jgi:hypothetical protein
MDDKNKPIDIKIDDKNKPIDIKNSRLKLEKKREEERRRLNEGVIRTLGRNVPPKKPPTKIPEPPKVSDPIKLNSARDRGASSTQDKTKQLEKEKMRLIQERVDQMKEEKRRAETQDYIAVVLEVAQDVYLKSQPQLAKSEEERMAIAERSIQAGQAFYKIAKEFVTYVKTENLINDLALKKGE